MLVNMHEYACVPYVNTLYTTCLQQMLPNCFLTSGTFIFSTAIARSTLVSSCGLKRGSSRNTSSV